jgi:hypothetical protein
MNATATEKRHLDFLTEIYTLTLNQPIKLKMYQYQRRHKVGTDLIKYFIDFGDLARVGSSTYRWVGPAPTLDRYRLICKNMRKPREETSDLLLLSQITAEELVSELRKRGYDVKASMTVTVVREL